MDIVRRAMWMAAGLIAGVILGGTALSARAPKFESIHAYWYMGRASGFVALGLLLVSVVLGLAVSSRVFDGLLVRPWVFELHQFISVYLVVVMVFHAFIMLPDPYAGFGIWQLASGFGSPYRPLAVGAGAVVLYGSAVVTVSYYVKGLIGQRGWRLLHYATFGLFVLALVHGAYAAADTGKGWAQNLYLSAGLSVLFFTLFRILASKAAARAAKSAPRRNAPETVAVPSAGG